MNRSRLINTWDVPLAVPAIGDVLVTVRFTKLVGDLDLRLVTVGLAGSIGIRLDGDTVDRAVLTGSELDIDIFADVAGVRTLTLIARAAPTSFTYGELIMLHK